MSKEKLLSALSKRELAESENNFNNEILKKRNKRDRKSSFQA